MQADQYDSSHDPCKIVIIGTRYSGKKTLENILVNDYKFLQMILPIKIKSMDSNDSGDLSPKIDLSKNGGITDLCYNQYQQRGVFVMQSYNVKALKHMKQRNFINVIFIDAPFITRYQYAKKQNLELTMEQFAELDMMDQTFQYEKCLEYVRIKLYNTGTIDDLKKQIKDKQNSIMRPFRPSWDQYFMKIADIARRRSNCMKSTVGAVIVNDKNRVVSTGYNGTPKGLPGCYQQGCKRCNSNQSKALDQCLCLHAEQSAIIQVGIRQTAGCRLYTTLYPCFSCAKVIKQAGIKKVYFMDPYDKVDNGKKFLEDNYAKQNIVNIKLDNVYY